METILIICISEDMKILIGVPSYNWNMEYIQPYLDTMEIPEWCDYDLLIVEKSTIVQARNRILEIAYKEGYDMLWMIDDDNPPINKDALLRATKLPWEIITWVVKSSIDRKSYCIYNRTDEANTMIADMWVWESMIVDMCGTWCIFLKKNAIAAMYQKYNGYPFEWKMTYFEKVDDTYIERLPWEKIVTGMLYSKFMWEDLLFTHRCTQAGFPIVATKHIKCVHYMKDWTILHP